MAEESSIEGHDDSSAQSSSSYLDEAHELEEEMTRLGLLMSSAAVPNADTSSEEQLSEHELHPLVLASPEAFFGLDRALLRKSNTPPRLAVQNSLDVAAESVTSAAARTELLMAFAFWPTEEKERPGAIARLLLTRQVQMANEQMVPLWERTKPPKEVAELALHFRQLLGFQGSEDSPVQRLCMTKEALGFLFADGRLWADTVEGKFAGRLGQWKQVHLRLFPHGAILSVVIDWMPLPNMYIGLGALRAWVAVAKYRSVKLGMARGWTFAKHESVANVEDAQQNLGLKLFAALYGGSCISLGAIANWLVKLPGDPPDGMSDRVSCIEQCVHHTAVGLLAPWSPPVAQTETALWLRPNAVASLALEDIFGFCWGSSASRKLFVKQFMGILAVLTRHCLAERATLERLSYLAALQAPQLPRQASLAEKDAAHRALHSLALMLARYRASMASDDCGGRPEFRDFFQGVREAYDVSVLKSELREDLRDTLRLVENDRIVERKQTTRLEQRFKQKSNKLEDRKQYIRDVQQRYLEVLIYALTAVFTPFFVLAAIFGMNNDSVPTDVSWGYLVLGCGVAAIFLFLLSVLNFIRRRPQLNAVKEEVHLIQELKILDRHQQALHEGTRLLDAQELY